MVKILLLLLLAGGAWLWWRRRTLGRARVTPSEARALLGISADASASEVREAHRRLIARVHPDAGGSDELALRVNQARDTLLAELRSRGK